jgi:carboxylesterase type B
MFSDRLFKADFRNALQYHATQSPTQCYYFKYQVEQSKSIIDYSGKSFGVAHGDDVFLIFNNRKLSEYNDEEILIGKNFVKMYENFATNDISTFGDSEIHNADKNLECLEIVSATTHSMVPLEKHFGNSEFWNSLKIIE